MLDKAQRSAMIRQAAALPKGSAERRSLLKSLKEGASPFDLRVVMEMLEESLRFAPYLERFPVEWGVDSGLEVRNIKINNVSRSGGDLNVWFDAEISLKGPVKSSKFPRKYYGQLDVDVRIKAKNMIAQFDWDDEFLLD